MEHIIFLVYMSSLLLLAYLLDRLIKWWFNKEKDKLRQRFFNLFRD